MTETQEYIQRKKARADRLKSILESCGVKVHSLVILGAYVHIDTNKSCENAVVTALLRMGGREFDIRPKGSVTLADCNYRKYHHISAKVGL